MQVPWEELGIGRQAFCKSLLWKEYFRPESLKWEYIHNVYICHFIAYKLHCKAGAKPNLKLPNSETIHNFSRSCVLCLAIWINWFKTLFKSAVLWVDTCYLAASLLGKGIEHVSRRLVPRGLSCVVLCFPNTLISSILLSPLLIASIPLLVAKPLLPASPFIQGKSPSLCCWEAEDDTSAVGVRFLWQIWPLKLSIPHRGGRVSSTFKAAVPIRFFLSVDLLQAFSDISAASWVAC